jgi:pyruvate dehydrogenase E2 component (dihydrolipoamide acetyltransferase)
MTDILMPALSPTMEEGILAKWNIKAGDTVRSGDVIAEIETDKATMEVEAVDEGVVEVILVPAGTENVKVNTPIARLRGEEESAAPSASAPDGPAPAPSSAADPPAPPSSPDAPAVQPAGPASAAPRTGLETAPQSGPERIFASPLARRLAAEKGLALEAIKGSGPHGRIIKADVEAAQAPASSRPAVAEPSPAPRRSDAPQEAASAARTLEQMGVPEGSYDLVPLDGMRRTIARRMAESFQTVPHFPLTIDLELDRLLDARVRINAALAEQGGKVSVNDILIKACALALRAVPEANASFTPDGIALHHHADIAVAVAIDGGLITPIIRAAETRSLADIATTMKDLAQRARSRKLRPEEFQGGTFSLSNLGMMGIKSFASIINEPHGCILSVGVGEKRPVVKDDQLAIATVMTVTLTCDHRAVDGAIGSKWLKHFKGFVEEPVTMLA